MSKHLVTGGAGFIGSHLCRRLVNQGNEVIAVDNFLAGTIKNIKDLLGCSNFLFIEGDLRNEELFIEVAKGVDCIWAIAANMGGIKMITDVAADIVRDNIRLNINALEACRINKVPHYFYSSSACVYPEYRQQDINVIPLKETDAFPAQPDQFYGWEKIFAERCVYAYKKDYSLNVRVVRFHNIFGEAYNAFDSQRGKAPAHMIIKAIKHPNPPFVVWGDGKQTRSFCYIDDCIDGILKLMASDYDEPINIGSDRLISMTDLANMALSLASKDAELKYDLTKPQGVRGRNSDNTLVKKVLNWSPQVSLEKGMEITYKWAVEHYDELEGL